MMTKINGALPATSGERDDDLFPIQQRLRLRDNFGLALIEFRQRPPFAAIERGPWTVFIAIACSWQNNPESWPSQETIAAFTGYTTRAVRDYINALEKAGFVRSRRQRYRDGGDRLYYAPGHTTLSALIAFMERYPRDSTVRAADEREQVARSFEDPETRALSARVSPPPSETTSASLPEMSSATLPEAISAELKEKLTRTSSWRDEPATTERAVCEEEQSDPSEISGEERAIAETVLSERIKRKHPKRRAPRLFDAGEIAIVVACSQAVEGDRAAKLQAHREAIEGAFLTSKNGPPSARFIWGTVEHFLDHAERGRRKLRGDERNERMKRAPDLPREPRVEGVEPNVSEERRKFDAALATLGQTQGARGSR